MPAIDTTVLSDEVKSALDRARAARGDEKAARAELEVAFLAVDFPAKGPDPMFPLPDALSPAQRALAQIVIDEGLPHDVNRLPGGVSARRWIGLDPPGPLETPVEHEGRAVPIWHRLRLARRTPHTLDGVDAVPLPRRLEVLACFEGLVWTYRIDPRQTEVWAYFARLDRDALQGCRDWALERLRSATPPAPESVRSARTLAERLAFAVLVRTGQPIEEAWDVFLPVPTEVPAAVPPAITGECARALTLPRIERVAVPLLRQCFGPAAIQAGLSILEHHDSVPLARFVWELSERSFPTTGRPSGRSSPSTRGPSRRWRHGSLAPRRARPSRAR